MNIEHIFMFESNSIRRYSQNWVINTALENFCLNTKFGLSENFVFVSKVEQLL